MAMFLVFVMYSKTKPAISSASEATVAPERRLSHEALDGKAPPVQGQLDLLNGKGMLCLSARVSKKGAERMAVAKEG
jgi:hypothetical protein